ncbi:hypothetical protein BDP27DRAFT_1426742 [Rhodocollybia butyracea]|uniref:DUF6729 domain-containing protein n=1 Tax=Rhodocollybia butyracea TaxID=206335 RepID=A0A9P5U3C9_9AGAR|nr:hypothetical protein BDP27DRAFT_1426742 [Rhodocollybia butyracea]
MPDSTSNFSSNADTQFVFYQPPNTSSSNTEGSGTRNEPQRKPGRPKRSESVLQYVPHEEAGPKHPVGQPRGSGHRQQVERDLARQRRDTPASYQPIGLVVPGTSSGSNASTWDTLMHRNPSSSTMRSPSAVSSPPEQPSTLLIHSEHVPSKNISMSSLSSHTVLERAQASSLLRLRCPSHPVCMDDNEMPEDQIDSLMAEGIGKDSLGEENSEEDRDEYNEEKNFDFEDPETSQVKPKKATNAKPYPSWFQDCLKEVTTQLKDDRSILSGQSRLHTSGLFWFPTKSLWSVLQKPVLHPMDLFIPQFFLWDPDDLISIGISCPSCNQSLNRNGILPHPCHIVDIDCSFWIVGYSYCCRSCKKNYRSWDRRILAKLPPQLSAQFPAHLTWQSGLSL